MDDPAIDHPGQTQHAIRRSTRLPLEVPVLVKSVDAALSFSELCHTTIVNVHGCGVIATRSLAAGDRVSVEIVPAGRRTTARVAHVVPLGGAPETWLVGLEFDIPSNFWGIEYAPSDWKIEDGPTAVEAGRRSDGNSNPATPKDHSSVLARRWRLTDISTGACYLESSAPFPARTPVLLSIRGANGECVLDGVVCVSHAQTGMGIAFAQGPGHEQIARLEELIDRLAITREVPRIFVGEKEREAAGTSPRLSTAQNDKADPLRQLICDATSLTLEQFLEDLRMQRLGNRRDPRIEIALPVVVSAIDDSRRAVEQQAMTVNVSRRGALLKGVHGSVKPNDVISLVVLTAARQQMKEQFRVAWVGAEESPAAGRIGVGALDPNTSFWSAVLEATAHSAVDRVGPNLSSGNWPR